MLTTMYATPRGVTSDPMTVELWNYSDLRPLSRIELADKISVTWSMQGPDTAEIVVPYSEATAPLMETNGRVLVVVQLNGRRHISTVTKAVLEPANKVDEAANISVTTSGAYSLLQAEVIPPSPGKPLTQQVERENFTMTAPVETVVKSIVHFGQNRVGHPLSLTPDLGRGPVVTVTGRMKYASELIEQALSGTGYRLALDPWFYGDPQPNNLGSGDPCVTVDVVPYRENPGLVFSRKGHDLEDWTLTRTRASRTQFIVGDSGQGTEQKFRFVMEEDVTHTPWSIREGYTSSQGDSKSEMISEGKKALADNAESYQLEATLAPSSVWEFGNDGKYPRQYDIGDWATINLGEVGEVRQVITEVTAELTPAAFTVTPKVTTPDTYPSDIYSTVASLAKRVDRLGG